MPELVDRVRAFNRRWTEGLRLLDEGLLATEHALARLEAKGLVESTPSPTDGRALDLALTPAGRAAYAELDARSVAQITALLSDLSDEQRATVAEAMTVITSLIRPGAGDRQVVL